MGRKIIHAPWTDEQVTLLELHQSCDYVHGYTCQCGQMLKPTVKGWVCPACGYAQSWALEPLTLDELAALDPQRLLFREKS